MFRLNTNEKYSRRWVLGGTFGAIAAGALLLAWPFKNLSRKINAKRRAVTFPEIPHLIEDNIHISPGYNFKVLLRAGDKIFVNSPEFLAGAENPLALEKQFGFSNSGVVFMPLPAGSHNSDDGLLIVSHQYPELIKRRGDAALASLGISIIQVKKEEDGWNYNFKSKYNRRITGLQGLCHISGPAAESDRLKTSYDETNKNLIGTTANGPAAKTPWGTVLSGEGDSTWAFLPKILTNFPARFNFKKEPGEQNRFGWIIEIDPYDEKSIPVKRTALGRFKHGSIAIALCPDGRVAVYSSDNEKDEHIYKFISHEKFDPENLPANKKLLDEGILYVAKISADGNCKWLPMIYGEGPLNQKNNFTNQADILIETRRAAALLSPTKMDKPAGIAIDGLSNKIYIAINSSGAYLKAKPSKNKKSKLARLEAKNEHGYIIELTPDNGDHALENCRWDVFMVGGFPKNDKGTLYNPKTLTSGYFSKPGSLNIDSQGRLWLMTDGQQKTFTSCDAIFASNLEGEDAAWPKHFMNMPKGATAAGMEFTPDYKTAFISVQHPAGITANQPNPSTRWPDFEKNMPPRSGIVAVTRKDDGEIGG